jgi:hypothetical protein
LQNLGHANDAVEDDASCTYAAEGFDCEGKEYIEIDNITWHIHTLEDLLSYLRDRYGIE